MSEIVISAENISKSYVIGHQRNPHDGLRHQMENAFRNPWKWFKGKVQEGQAEEEEFWALKGVSFQVKRGEAIGIIGRNGAGKSTLLKILSRITDPTEGSVRIKGRVACLLEVGTGFHPDLTGRENIFLNGAILGMTNVEIRRKFDAIVAFSEIEKFLDTPVKRYSSGMYVKLAFAVAAHLEPEILIVDEVLAVGDAQFQKKCLGKMEDVAQQGRAVLFVSHNLGAVRRMCSTGLLLNQGRVQSCGPIREVMDSYLNEGVDYSGVWLREKPVPKADGIYFQKVRILNEDGDIAGHLDCIGGFKVEIQVCSNHDFENAQIAIRFSNQDGVVIFTTCNTDSHGRFVAIRKGIHTYQVSIPSNLIVPGTYTLQLASHIPARQLFDVIDNTIAFCVEETGSVALITNDQRLGVVSPILAWNPV